MNYIYLRIYYIYKNARHCQCVVRGFIPVTTPVQPTGMLYAYVIMYAYVRACIRAWMLAPLFAFEFMVELVSIYLVIYLCECVNVDFPCTPIKYLLAVVVVAMAVQQRKNSNRQINASASIALLQCITNTTVNIIKIDYSLTQLYIEWSGITVVNIG